MSVAFVFSDAPRVPWDPGKLGLPSIVTIEDPTTNPPMRVFHIIVAVVENQQNWLPGPRSKCRAVILQRLEEDAAVAVHDGLLACRWFRRRRG